MAVSWVLLGSSQSSSKKSSGGTNGPYHRVRMRNWRNPGSSGQSVPPWRNRLRNRPREPRRPNRRRPLPADGRARPGGFGSVYTGHDSASGEAVAVKVFSRGEGLAPRADREARTAQQARPPQHPRGGRRRARRRSRLPDLPAGGRRAVRPQRPHRRAGRARDRRRLRRARARTRARGRCIAT